jgi:hypothetical protein
MAIKRPDTYEHNNPNLPIADSDFVRGGSRSAVQTLNDLYALTGKASQLKQHSTQIYVSGENKIYLLKDSNNIGNSNGWEEFNFGGGTNVVYTTGNQTISGVKTFASRPTVNGTGVLLSGEAVSNSTNSYVIANPGDDLLSKYQLAKSLNPNNTSKNGINRSSLILTPGVYNLTGHWDISEEFVDILGIGAVKKDVGCIPAVIITGSGSVPGSSGFVHVSANDVKIKGVYFSGSLSNFFYLGNTLPKQIFEDCKGNSRSFIFSRPFGFNDPISIDGTFINCEGENFSFTVPSQTHTSNGTFINCKAGTDSFSNSSTTQLNGLYKNCQAGNNSFGAGGIGGILNGTFENCVAGDKSFGWGGFPDLYGKFKNCTAGNVSFGFGGGIQITGTFENCVAGEASFGFATSTLSGATFINCTAGPSSWQGVGGVRMLGKLYQCRLTNVTGDPLNSPIYSFGIPSGVGLLRNCIDGDNNIVDG